MLDADLDEAVGQQLREELLARVWVLDGIFSNPPSGGAEAAGQRVDAAAARWCSMLRETSPTARRRAAEVIVRMLWPTFLPADEWWATPLGVALVMARTSRALCAVPADATELTAEAAEVNRLSPLAHAATG
jgi:hypothetical protein